MDCSPSDSAVHGILQARILDWVAIPLDSKGSSWPRDRTQISCIAGRFLTWEATREPLGQVQTVVYQGTEKIQRQERKIKKQRLKWLSSSSSRHYSKSCGREQNISLLMTMVYDYDYWLWSWTKHKFASLMSLSPLLNFLKFLLWESWSCFVQAEFMCLSPQVDSSGRQNGFLFISWSLVPGME